VVHKRKGNKLDCIEKDNVRSWRYGGAAEQIGGIKSIKIIFHSEKSDMNL
jgi:hypothetical protein